MRVATEPPLTSGIVKSTRSSSPAHDNGVTTCSCAMRVACSRMKRTSEEESDWRSTLPA